MAAPKGSVPWGNRAAVKAGEVPHKISESTKASQKKGGIKENREPIPSDGGCPARETVAKNGNESEDWGREVGEARGRKEN